MNALKICALGLIPFSMMLADEQAPFDAPQAMEETAPSLEVVEIVAATSEIDAPFVEDFKELPSDVAVEADAPALVDAAIEPTVSEQEIAMNMDESIPEKVDLPVAVKTASHSKESKAASPSPRTPMISQPIQIDMREVFKGAPLIYCALMLMSIATAALWFYTLLKMRSDKLMPDEVVSLLHEKLREGKTEEALAICKSNPSLLTRMVNSGLLAKDANYLDRLETMQNEGKRSSANFWRKLALLNDVALVAPMIGLLGTVVGMFYAFYDMNRSVDSMSTLFDGLGVSVGTTVAGLILAIMAMILHSTSKYRLVKQLTRVEATANKLASLLQEKAP